MARAQSDHTTRHTINCSLTGGVHLFLTRVMGLSEEDNRARSTAGPAPHNHSHYWDIETVKEWTSSVSEFTINGEVMLVNNTRYGFLRGGF